jgi:hypothetical protein
MLARGRGVGSLIMNALRERDRRKMRKYLNARFGPGQACVNRLGQVLIRQNISNNDQVGWAVLGDCRDFLQDIGDSASKRTRHQRSPRSKRRVNQSSAAKIDEMPDVRARGAPSPKGEFKADVECKGAQLSRELLKARREYEAPQKAALDRMQTLKALRLARNAEEKADKEGT